MNERQLEALERALKLHARSRQLSDDDLSGWSSYLQRRFRLSDAELAEVREEAARTGRWAQEKVARLFGRQHERFR